jgi:hypothetical protein
MEKSLKRNKSVLLVALLLLSALLLAGCGPGDPQ